MGLALPWSARAYFAGWADQQVVELSFQLDDFGLGGLSTTLGLSSGGRFLITSLAIPAGGLLDLLQLILQPCNLGVLFLGDRMGGLVVLHGLGQLVLQICDALLSVAGAVSHGAQAQSLSMFSAARSKQPSKAVAR